MNASEHDAVIFAGSGSTAAVHKLIHALRLKTSPVRTLLIPACLQLYLCNKRLIFITLIVPVRALGAIRCLN